LRQRGIAVERTAVEPDEVGRRIRAARLARGWTHEELARRMGVNWRTVHRWQKGGLPRVETLVRIAEVFDLPRAYFVESEDDATSFADLRDRLDELARRLDALTSAVERLTVAPPAGEGGLDDRAAIARSMR
jgi:transcriptional regulator with XRE-family HTH domain